jgi:hypothetical protein
MSSTIGWLIIGCVSFGVYCLVVLENRFKVAFHKFTTSNVQRVKYKMSDPSSFCKFNG